jgi:hypothetical protein
MKRATTIRVAKHGLIPFTPRMRDGLALLHRGEDLAVERTHIGRPTKQRLSKFGLAEYTTPRDWDGPMRLTDEGRRVWADFVKEMT